MSDKSEPGKIVQIAVSECDEGRTLCVLTKSGEIWSREWRNHKYNWKFVPGPTAKDREQ